MKSLSLSLSALILIGIMFMAIRQSQSLKKIHQQLKNNHPQVQHMSQQKFLALDANSALVFDVREQKEFEVSHIKGAIRIPPLMSSTEFIERYGKVDRDKSLVFYCSVGRRSSALIQRLLEEKSLNSTNLHNLEGGIFLWHNNYHALYRGQQPTDTVHPYNWYWARLLDRPDVTQYDTTK